MNFQSSLALLTPSERFLINIYQFKERKENEEEESIRVFKIYIVESNLFIFNVRTMINTLPMIVQNTTF